MKSSKNIFKYDAVIFDLDGTLLDTSEGIIKSVDYTIKKIGLRALTFEEKKSFIGPPIQHSFKRVYSLDDPTTKLAASVFRTQYSEVDLFEARVYEGVFELLSFLCENGIKIGVATYKREDYAYKILDYFNLSKYFDCIQGSDFEGKLTKKDIINICIDKLNVKKDLVVMVGDTENDKIGAAQADVDFLGVGYGFGYEECESGIKLFAKKVSDIKQLLHKEVRLS